MLVLPDTVTVSQARDVLGMLEQSMAHDGAAELVVDAAALQDFDSAAIAVLLECARLAKAWGKPFVVAGAPAKLVELAGLYGVDALLGIRAQGAAGA